MTQEELYKLYEKVKDIIENYSYDHTHYSCQEAESDSFYGGFILFKVYGYSDDDPEEGWTEIWGIGIDGKIHIYTDDEVFDNFETFVRDWA